MMHDVPTCLQVLKNIENSYVHVLYVLTRNKNPEKYGITSNVHVPAESDPQNMKKPTKSGRVYLPVLLVLLSESWPGGYWSSAGPLVSSRMPR